MATANIACGAIGSVDQFVAFPALSDKVAAVANDASADDDTYMVTGVQSTEQRYTLASHSIPAGATINSVVLVFRHKRNGASSGAITGKIAIGADITSDTQQTSAGAYSTRTSAALARPGGGSWALADLATMEVGLLNPHATQLTRATYLYITVDYTEAGSGSTNNLLLLGVG